MPSDKLGNLERVQIERVSDLRDWLIVNHMQSESVWLVTFKKSAAPENYVSYDAFVDEIICFGWIDSVPRKLDQSRTMHLLSPRKAGSAWSAVNKDRVKRMELEQKMYPAGLEVVRQAKLDGSWDFLNDVDALIEPSDLASNLNQEPAARTHWDSFSRSSRRGILEWIKQAKRRETREKRISETVRLAKANIKANH